MRLRWAALTTTLTLALAACAGSTSAGVPASTSSSISAAAGPWDTVVYLPYYSELDLTTVPWALVTDVSYSFVQLDSSGVAGPRPDDPRFDATTAQLRAIREEHPQLRLILAVGGGGLSESFPDATTPERVQASVDSLDALLEATDFDGIDIDWEFPAIGTEEPAQFVSLLQLLREKLDERSATTGRRYLLGAAASGLPDSPAGMEGASATPPDAAQYVDRWDVMAYDYNGSWSCGTEDWRTGTGHLAALYATDDRQPDAAGAVAVERWLAHGIPADRLRFGVPFYGVTWDGVAPGPSGNGYGQPCDPAASGYLKWFEHEAGPPAEDCVDGVDEAAGAAWRYCPSLGRFASFDTPETIATKIAWARAQGLGGVLAWELTADDPSFSLLHALAGR
jgi:chitinase